MKIFQIAGRQITFLHINMIPHLRKTCLINSSAAFSNKDNESLVVIANSVNVYHGLRYSVASFSRKKSVEALKKPFTVGCNHLLKNVDLLVRELYSSYRMDCHNQYKISGWWLK